MNYQEALKRTESAYDWTSLSSSSIKSGSSSSSIPESQSNHSNQSDSGVSDTQPAGHVRSQSIVSSIFSEAWKRGTQLEESSKVGNTLVIIYIKKIFDVPWVSLLLLFLY